MPVDTSGLDITKSISPGSFDGSRITALHGRSMAKIGKQDLNTKDRIQAPLWYPTD